MKYDSNFLRQFSSMVGVPFLQGPTMVSAHVYGGYRTNNKVYFHGRLVEIPSRLRHPKNGDSLFSRLSRTLTYRQISPVTKKTVYATIGDNVFEITTDDEGYFSQTLDDNFNSNFKNLEVSISLENKRGHGPHTIGTGTVVNLTSCKTIVVTDLDGTIIDNKPFKQIQLFFQTLFGSADRLKPYSDVHRLFLKLQSQKIPIIYVSSSPNQLYQRLKFFLDAHRFPQGPLFLKPLKHRDIKGQISELRNNKDSKLKQISDIIEDLPDYQFVLLGDDANDDIEIFSELGRRFGPKLVFVGIHKILPSGTSKLPKEHIPFISYGDLQLKLQEKNILL